MEEKIQKKLGFTIGIFDEISDNIKKKIYEESCKCETFGVGVYTDKFIIENFMTYPSKSLDERISIAKKIEGVDFTFIVDTADSSKVKVIIEDAYENYIKNC